MDIDEGEHCWPFPMHGMGSPSTENEPRGHKDSMGERMMGCHSRTSMARDAIPVNLPWAYTRVWTT
jgi:hypothetical protein